MFLICVACVVDASVLSGKDTTKSRKENLRKFVFCLEVSGKQSLQFSRKDHY